MVLRRITLDRPCGVRLVRFGHEREMLCPGVSLPHEEKHPEFRRAPHVDHGLDVSGFLHRLRQRDLVLGGELEAPELVEPGKRTQQPFKVAVGNRWLAFRWFGRSVRQCS